MEIHIIAFTEKGYRLSERLRAQWLSSPGRWDGEKTPSSPVDASAGDEWKTLETESTEAEPLEITLHAKTTALPELSDPRSLHDIVAACFASAHQASKDGDRKLRDAGSSEEENVHISDRTVDKLSNATLEDPHRGCDALLFVGATGIAVRAIAPFLAGKAVDPAVLVIDEAGHYVISLLSGHLGGANALARTIAPLLGAEPIITTATDEESAFSVDLFAKENGFLLMDLRKAKEVAAKVLRGEKLRIYTDIPLERLSKRPTMQEAELVSLKESADADILLSYRTTLLDSMVHAEAVPQLSTSIDRTTDVAAVQQEDSRLRTSVSVQSVASAPLEHSSGEAPSLPSTIHRSIGLRLIAKKVYVGIGARKGVMQAEVAKAVTTCLADAGIDLRAVAALVSIDLKKQEAGILAYSYEAGIPFVTYTAEELRSVDGSFAASSFVQSVTGVANVCERAAAFAAGRNGHAEVLVHKTIYGNVTTAVAVEV